MGLVSQEGTVRYQQQEEEEEEEEAVEAGVLEPAVAVRIVATTACGVHRHLRQRYHLEAQQVAAEEVDMIAEIYASDVRKRLLRWHRPGHPEAVAVAAMPTCYPWEEEQTTLVVQIYLA